MRRDIDKYYTLDAARSRLAQEPDAASLPDALFASAALGRVPGVSAVVRCATPFEAMTFQGVQADAVRVALRQVLRAVSAYECRLPAARWFSGKRWRQLLGAAAREPAR